MKEIKIEHQNTSRNMSSRESFDGDHREKNILLAKNLNQVKMDLRSKKKDLMALQSLLRHEKQRNSKLETEQVTIINRIDHLKKQLDDTFIKNTFGYIQLSQQLDEMHQENAQNDGQTSLVGVTNAATTPQSTFLAKIKRMSESFMPSDVSIGVAGPNNSTLNGSNSTTRRHSLSFNTFRMGLNSTFVKDTSGETDLNCTFLAEEPENQTHESPMPLSGIENVTVRKDKSTSRIDQSRVKSQVVRNLYSRQKENQPMATGSHDSPASKTFVLRRGCRSIKKVDYNENSFRRKK